MGVHDVFFITRTGSRGESLRLQASGAADVFEKLGATNYGGTGRLQNDPPEYQRYKSAAS